MAIDITGPSSQQATTARARANEQNSTSSLRSESAAVPAQPSNRGGDTVQLSNEAQTLRNVERSLADTPDVDSARVANLRQEIESGNFQVNAERVAEKILDFDTLL